MLDASLLKYKPSVLAACMIFLGFQLQFELNLNGYELTTESGRAKVAQVCEVYRIWMRILQQGLEVPDIPKIIDFCDMLFDRQISLYEEYRSQFKNVYRERVAEYFKPAPKRTVSVHQGHQSRTQESPSRI